MASFLRKSRSAGRAASRDVAGALAAPVARGPLALAAVVVLFLGATGALRGQEEGPVSPDSADAIRDSLVQPPGSHPPDVYDALSFPFRVATFPLVLVGTALRELAGLAFVPGRPPSPIIRAFRAMVEWGAVPSYETVGPRSGPGVGLSLVHFRPFYLETAYTIRGSQRHAVGIEVGREDGPAAGRLEGSFRRYAEPHFWGVGPGTREEDEVDFRWDHGEVALQGALQGDVVGLELEAAAEHNEVERGFDDDSPDLLDVLDPDTLFGAGERTRYARLGGSAVLDLTHWTLMQQRGFRAILGTTAFLGIDGTDSDFLRWNAEVHGYLPLNDRQQLAVRTMLELNRSQGGRGVPFTHLAALGGHAGLRGFDTNRFRDTDRLAVMGEWRYEIWRSIHEDLKVESFVFVDAGNVARRVTDLPGLETSYGFGMRALGAAPHLIGLWYLGFSEEDVRFSLQFSWPF